MHLTQLHLIWKLFGRRGLQCGVSTVPAGTKGTCKVLSRTAPQKDKKTSAAFGVLKRAVLI